MKKTFHRMCRGAPLCARTLFVGVLCLAIPVVTGADLFNTASVSYRDPAGVLRSGVSNTVTVLVDIPTDPVGLPDPDLSSLDGRTFTLRDTLILPYHGHVSGFNWLFIPTDAGSRISNFHAAAQSGVPYFTSAPSISAADLSLAAGRYTLQVQALNGSHQSRWISATITFVSADLASAKVYPNPFRAARGDMVVHFEPLSADCTIKIFTVSGRLVQTLDGSGGSTSWNLTNDAGDKVASGLYLYLIIDGQGNKTHGKLAVIR